MGIAPGAARACGNKGLNGAGVADQLAFRVTASLAAAAAALGGSSEQAIATLVAAGGAADSAASQLDPVLNFLNNSVDQVCRRCIVAWPEIERSMRQLCGVRNAKS